MNSPGQLLLYRECNPVVDAHYRPDRDDSLAASIIGALADAAGVGPVELPSLHDYIDLDALNSLFESQRGKTDAAITVSFQIGIWNVFVRSDGRIRVCDATRPTEPEPVF
jgi:hypothetical protein